MASLWSPRVAAWNTVYYTHPASDRRARIMLLDTITLYWHAGILSTVCVVCTEVKSLLLSWMNVGPYFGKNMYFVVMVENTSLEWLYKSVKSRSVQSMINHSSGLAKAKTGLKLIHPPLCRMQTPAKQFYAESGNYFVMLWHFIHTVLPPSFFSLHLYSSNLKWQILYVI